MSAPHNRTLTLNEDERAALRARLLTPAALAGPTRGEATDGASPPDALLDRTVHGDLLDVLPLLPDALADLIVVDPPYNLSKRFGAQRFGARSDADYRAYLASWMPAVAAKLRPTGTMYVCGDWRCSAALHDAIQATGLTLINRITWQRDKGRGAAHNWKNGMEDIWMAVADPHRYYFDVEAVKLKRRVRAPYRDASGAPKGWTDGYRMTHPSNFWDDVTIPFWSMPENTDHPTQKPEKLVAKLMLASSRPGDVVLDPFLGSGTTSVVARKLGRRYLGIELDETYCLLAEKRLARAARDATIQGYADGVFWERNSSLFRNRGKSRQP